MSKINYSIYLSWNFLYDGSKLQEDTWKET